MKFNNVEWILVHLRGQRSSDLCYVTTPYHMTYWIIHLCVCTNSFSDIYSDYNVVYGRGDPPNQNVPPKNMLQSPPQTHTHTDKMQLSWNTFDEYSYSHIPDTEPKVCGRWGDQQAEYTMPVWSGKTERQLPVWGSHSLTVPSHEELTTSCSWRVTLHWTLDTYNMYIII